MRTFFIFSLIPLIANTLYADLSKISKAQITSSLPVHKEHHPNNMLDGNLETYYWISRALKKDEVITLQLPTALPTGQNITVRAGLPKGGDGFDDGLLEGSVDGKVWKILSDGKSGLLTATLTRPLKHFRLRATRNIPHWVAFREIELPLKPPLKSSRGHTLYKKQKIPLTLTGHLGGFDDLEPRFDEMAELYFKIWPKLVNMLGSPVQETHRDVIIRFQEKMDHPAHASGKTIVISATHLRKDPSDTIGVFIHELTHIIQRHRGPGWFIEGTADYTRFKLKNDDNWAKRCRKHIYYNKPFGKYWSSAAFLLYLEDQYKKPIVRPVSVALRSKTYKEDIWKKLTGKTLEGLATDYKTSGWKPKQ